MDGAHVLPIDAISLTNDLQQVLRDVGKQSISNGIKHNSAKSYSRRVIERLNK